MNLLKRAEKNILNAEEVKDNKLEKMDVPIPVVRQIENSELELTSYTEEGSQLVTNVLLANDNRENNRKNTDKRERHDRLKAIEFESEIANSKFMEISSQWPIILKQNDALEIHANSELQKKRGFDLIDQKNQMIEVLKRDLAESDFRFLQEQAAQSEDIRILQERIENQVKFMRKQYKNHIQYIKSTMDQQREFRIDKAHEGWKIRYNEMIMTESKSIDDRLAMTEKKENNIMKQHEMNEEIMRNLKFNINTELDNIQREFDLVKMKCIENVEKLNYNYQVLKRREEENAQAKAAQRRKINRLQDILSNKRKILREIKTEFEAKVPLLQDEIEKLKQDIERHEKKRERFAEIQEKTFKELWDFSQKQIDSRLERIFEIDRIIHEKQLSVDWQLPRKLRYLDISDLPSYRKKPDAPSAETAVARPDDEQSASTVAGPYAEARERSLLRSVFGASARNASFVLDDALVEAARSRPKRDLALLYNAMAACGLNSAGSWRLLLSGARSTATCAACRGPVLRWSEETDRVGGSAGGRQTAADSGWKIESENKLINEMLVFTETHTKYIDNIVSSNCTDLMEKTPEKNYRSFFERKPATWLADVNTAAIADTRSYHSLERANTDSDNSTITFSLSLTDFEQLCSENESNPAIKFQHSISQIELDHFPMQSEEHGDFTETKALKFSEDVNGEKNRGLMCDNADHPLTIKDTDYLRVVKLAIDASKSKSSDRRGENESDFYLTSTLAVKDIGDYWTQFLYAFPEDRLKRWEVFEKAVKKYYQTLHLRLKKMEEVEKLEKENAELKNILKQFMDADQDDVRLRNVCTPRIKKQQVQSSKTNSKPTMFTDESTNVCGTTIHILTMNRPNKKTTNRPFTAPTKK